nr:MAG TPA: hypothetical protein [Crassvirales sp.]
MLPKIGVLTRVHEKAPTISRGALFPNATLGFRNNVGAKVVKNL